MPKSLNLFNKRFGKLLAIKPLNKRNNRRIVWKCLCNCGSFKEVPAENLTRNYTKSCGCEAYHKRLPKGEYAIRTIYGNYKRWAEKKNRVFELTLEKFKEIAAKDCYYCGSPPIQRVYRGKRKDFVIYNGIDRKNNSLGYTQRNSLPCCKYCNNMKHTMSIKKFKEHINKIYNHQND